MLKRDLENYLLRRRMNVPSDHREMNILDNVHERLRTARTRSDAYLESAIANNERTRYAVSRTSDNSIRIRQRWYCKQLQNIGTL